MKILPPGPGKDLDEVAAEQSTTQNHQHAIKMMYLGIVGNPVPKEVFGGNEDFDVKVFLDQVLTKVGYKNFTDIASNNREVKCGHRINLL